MILFSAVGCGGGSDADKSPATSVSNVSSAAELIRPVSRASTSLPSTAADASNTSSIIAAEIAAILSAYDSDRHYNHVEQLASDALEGRLAGSQGAQKAATIIEGHFSAAGLEPWGSLGLDSYRQGFSLEGVEDDNIIGILPGSNDTKGYVILAAHYDHLGVSIYGPVYNGADDNAAGVGAVMEAARLLRASGLQPEKTIVFCAFSGEEAGQLGARALGSLITDRGLAGAVEMINIDGIGATGGSYLGVWDEGTPAAAPLTEALRRAGGYTGVTVVEEGTDIGSDAQPFDWLYGIPAVTVDWDWGSDPSAYHPYYHTTDDDATRIDRSVMTQATRTILAGLWMRASEKN